MENLTKSFLITPQMSAKQMNSGSLDVLATPAMIACMEDVAKTIIEPLLSLDESSVGTNISVSHIKASGIGSTITIVAKLINREKNLFYFEIIATENGMLIGEASHTRASINIEKFMAKLL